MSDSPKRVLFVCVENSNRSQMAQAFAKIHGGDAVEAYSAGSRPSGKVNPRAIAAMAEIRALGVINVSSGPRAGITPELGAHHRSVMMLAQQICPHTADPQGRGPGKIHGPYREKYARVDMRYFAYE